MAWGKALVLAVSALFAGSFGETIGDFAALEVGNKWEYATVRSMGGTLGRNRTDSLSITTISVQAKAESEGTTVYSLSITDSAYAIVEVPFTSPGTESPPGTTTSINVVVRTKRQVSETDGRIHGDTAMRDCLACQMFVQREYEAAELRDTLIGSVPYRVKAIEKPNGAFAGSSQATYATGVGLIRYAYLIYWDRSYHSAQSGLLEFNDVPLDPTGITEPRRARRGIHRALPPFRGFNLLGRRLSRPETVSAPGR